MSIAPPGQTATAGKAYTSQKTAETPTTRPEDSRKTGQGQDPGGSPPPDFGHRDPDYNHDGVISDAESRVYDADTRSADRRYDTDSRERMSHEREEGKNYRAELQANTAQVQSNNDNKMHKLFGKDMGPPPPPPISPTSLSKPEGF
jgi:hypothetical protein